MRIASTRESPRPALRAIPSRRCSTRSRGMTSLCWAGASSRTPKKSGSTFGPGRPIAVDPVPRLITAGEWATPRGRARAARQRAQRLPRRRLRRPADLRRRGGAAAAAGDLSGYEPRCGDCSTRLPAATVAGLDLVRDPTASCGCSRTTCGCPRAAYALAVREIVEPELGEPAATPRRFLERSARRSGPRPRRGGEPRAASSPTARRTAPGTSTRGSRRELGCRSSAGAARDQPRAVVRPDGRDRRPVDVVYRRLDEDRLSEPDGSPTPLGELLLPAFVGPAALRQRLRHGPRRRQARPRLRRGMVGFYLGEEPLLRSVASYRPLREERAATASSGSTNWWSSRAAASAATG